MGLIPLSKAKVKLISALARKKYRQKHGRFVVEGKKGVQEALSSGWKVDFVVVREQMISEDWITNVATDVFVAEEDIFREITQHVSPEGVLAVLHLPESVQPPADILGSVFVLDDLRDPGNLGTILRCADWFGFSALVCSRASVDVFNPKVLRATMGSVFRVPVYYTDLLPWLQAQTHPIYIADLDGTALSASFEFDPNARILIGNEANGLNPEIVQALDAEVVTIPRFGKAESLNAAMTGAILAWHTRMKG